MPDATEPSDVELTAAATSGGHAECLERLRQAAHDAVGRADADTLALALAWVAVAEDFTTDTEAWWQLLDAAILTDNVVLRPMVAAADARLSARRPVGTTGPEFFGEPEGAAPASLVSWTVEVGRSQTLAEEAAASSASALERVNALCAWRAVHRSPRALDGRLRVVDAVDREIGAARPRGLLRSLACDSRMWHLADALESGDRAAFEHTFRHVRADLRGGGLAHHRWWAATVKVTANVLDGDLVAAQHALDDSLRIGGDLAHPGALSVWLLQAWWLDDLAGRSTRTAELARAHSSLLDHPLSTLPAGVAFARIGDLDEAARWARWVVRWMSVDGAEETSWLATITLGADLATLLLRGGHEAGQQLAHSILPAMQEWRALHAVDSRATLSLGPVARAEADVLLELGSTVEAASAVAGAEQVVARLGHPPVAVAQVALSRARLAVAENEDPSGWIQTAIEATRRPGLDRLRGEAQQLALSTARSNRSSAMGLTERERAVLSGISEGLSNPEIAERLRYSVSTIAKDTMHIYRKLGIRDRSEAMRASHTESSH